MIKKLLGLSLLILPAFVFAQATDDNEINRITKLYAVDERKFLTKDLVNVFNKRF